MESRITIENIKKETVGHIGSCSCGWCSDRKHYISRGFYASSMAESNAFSDHVRHQFGVPRDERSNHKYVVIDITSTVSAPTIK